MDDLDIRTSILFKDLNGNEDHLNSLPSAINVCSFKEALLIVSVIILTLICDFFIFK